MLGSAVKGLAASPELLGGGLHVLAAGSPSAALRPPVHLLPEVPYELLDGMVMVTVMLVKKPRLGGTRVIGRTVRLRGRRVMVVTLGRRVEKMVELRRRPKEMIHQVTGTPRCGRLGTTLYTRVVRRSHGYVIMIMLASMKLAIAVNCSGICRSHMVTMMPQVIGIKTKEAAEAVSFREVVVVHLAFGRAISKLIGNCTCYITRLLLFDERGLLQLFRSDLKAAKIRCVRTIKPACQLVCSCINR